jgi:peptidylprolyl isomerase
MPLRRRDLLALSVAAATLAAAPAFAADDNTVFIDTKDGRIAIALRPDLAPKHVAQIKALTAKGFYDGVVFHRVIDGFMAQGGDPRGNGSGGSTLPNLPQEFNGLPHVRGALSMARADDPNSANSQFFIMLMPRLSLDRNYTVFGRVVTGIEFVDRIQRGEPPVHPTRIVQASIMADNRPQPPAAALNADAATPAAIPTATDLNAPLQSGN